MISAESCCEFEKSVYCRTVTGCSELTLSVDGSSCSHLHFKTSKLKLNIKLLAINIQLLSSL